MEDAIVILEPVPGLKVTVGPGRSSGTVESNLREPCVHCFNKPEYCHCEIDFILPKYQERFILQAKSNAAIDALESLILAHAMAGVDIMDERYVEGINTAIASIFNRFC